MDWTIPDEIRDEWKDDGPAAQILATTNHWAGKLAAEMTQAELLDLFKTLSQEYWELAYHIHQSSSARQCDRLAWLGRKKGAVVQALVMQMVRHIEDPLADEYDRLCKQYDEWLGSEQFEKDMAEHQKQCEERRAKRQQEKPGEP
jgi:hypothetical protein